MKTIFFTFLLAVAVGVGLFCQREVGLSGPGGRAKVVLVGEWNKYSAGSGYYVYKGFVQNKGDRRADRTRVVFSWPQQGIVDSGWVSGLTFVSTDNETTHSSLKPGQKGACEVYTMGSGTGWNVTVRWDELEGTLIEE